MNWYVPLHVDMLWELFNSPIIQSIGDSTCDKLCLLVLQWRSMVEELLDLETTLDGNKVEPTPPKTTACIVSYSGQERMCEGRIIYIARMFSNFWGGLYSTDKGINFHNRHFKSLEPQEINSSFHQYF